MTDVHASVRKALLKPLTVRSERLADRKALLAALGRLDQRALREDELAALRPVLQERREARGKQGWKDPEAARGFVHLAQVLYASRRISAQEYVFYATSPVEGVHEGRWMDGHYDDALKPISDRLQSIRDENGLDPEEAWARGEGPEEFQRLNERYERILDEKLFGTLIEFGLDDLAMLMRERPEEFDAKRERGRRAVFHKDEPVHVIEDIVMRLERDARTAADAGAYSAAITSLGAGVEGLLLLRCLRSPKEAAEIAGRLPRGRRPRSTNDPTKWRFGVLIDVCLEAGWLPPVETSYASYDPAALAHILREMRNYVHPGRRARERPWVDTEERDVQDAEDIYVILLSALRSQDEGKGDGAN